MFYVTITIHKNMGLINKVDMVCLSPVGYCDTQYPTGDKHTISTLLIKPIFSVLAHAEKHFFSKLAFEWQFTRAWL